MGRSKLPLEIDGVPLIQRVYDVLASGCNEVVIVGAEDFSMLQDVRRVPDLRPGRGPLAGMEAGLRAARHPFVLVAAGDLPFLPPTLVEFLLGRVAAGATAAVPVFDGLAHPLCAAYDHEVLPTISSALDDGVGAVRTFLGLLDGVEYVDYELQHFGNPATFLMNVNSPGDLDRARAVLRESRP